MSNNHTNKSWNVAKVTRDAVVNTAEQVQILNEKSTEFARDAGHNLAELGKEVRDGLKEGVAEVQKKNRKK